MPKISVIVPVYRAEAYLHACVDSILSQTYENLEIFLVEDGSPDGSGAICDAYAEKDSRIHVIHQENQGQAAARNHALEKATGEWVCFVDSDDVIHPNMVQWLLQAAIETDSQISQCRMLEAPTMPEAFLAQQTITYEALDVNEKTLLSLYDRDEYPAWVACDKLVKTELVRSHLFAEGKVFEDNEAVCHWVCGAKRMVRLPMELYYYRTNLESTTKSDFSLKKLDYLWALENIIRFYDAIGYDQMKQRFASRYAEAMVNSCNGVRYTLQQPELVKGLEKRLRAFIREQKLCLSQDQKEQLLDVMHPKLIKLYWPLAGAVRTWKEAGFSGLAGKIKKRLTGGNDQ